LGLLSSPTLFCDEPKHDSDSLPTFSKRPIAPSKNATTCTPDEEIEKLTAMLKAQLEAPENENRAKGKPKDNSQVLPDISPPETSQKEIRYDRIDVLTKLILENEINLLKLQNSFLNNLRKDVTDPKARRSIENEMSHLQSLIRDKSRKPGEGDGSVFGQIPHSIKLKKPKSYPSELRKP